MLHSSWRMSLIRYPKDRTVNEVATKRLEAIRDFAEFGAGFKIAIRDLEIRGAGNLLGAEQHGHLDAVGYELYIKLLNEAVLAERGEKVPEKVECTITIKRIKYVNNLTFFMSTYRNTATHMNND